MASPSILEIVPFMASTMNRNVAASIISPFFRTDFFDTMIGVMAAVMPRISPIFAMFDPMTLPSAIPSLPFIDDVTLTSSSGADVPNATIVIPMTIGDMLNLRAMAIPPSTSQSPP